MTTYRVRLEKGTEISGFVADSPGEAAESFVVVYGVHDLSEGAESAEVVCIVTDSTDNEWRVTVYIDWVPELSSDAVPVGPCKCGNPAVCPDAGRQ